MAPIRRVGSCSRIRRLTVTSFGQKPAFKALMSKHNATANQLVLAWMLKHSPVMLPIPGTSKVKHLEENTAAAAIVLSDEDYETLSGLR